MDTNKTTIQITRATWQHINAAKRQPRESMDKALRRLLGLPPLPPATLMDRVRGEVALMDRVREG